MCYTLALLALVPFTAAAPPSDPVKAELKLFQGSWKAVSLQQADGRPATEEEIKATRLVVDGNKFTMTGKNFTISGTFTVNPTQTPRHIDVVLTSKEGVETKFPGIYQWNKDTRKSCFAMPDKQRPAQFTSEKGLFGFEWKRD